MKVRVRPIDSGYVLAPGRNWAPGTYATAQAAARAAWNMRDHGTTEDQTEEPPCPTT